MRRQREPRVGSGETQGQVPSHFRVLVCSEQEPGWRNLRASLGKGGPIVTQPAHLAWVTAAMVCASFLCLEVSALKR